MSRKPNSTLIGVFVVIGLALGIAALLIFSSPKLFTQKTDYILYFKQSLNGLTEGAPVKIRGVTVGSVKRVMIHYNQAESDTAMPVIVELQENLLEARLGPESKILVERALKGTISSDLRAVLKAESLLTGVLYIDIEKMSNPPPPVYHQIEKRYPEIPTQPSEIQALMENLAQLDIKGLEEKLSALVTHIDAALAELNVAEINANVTNLLTSADALVGSPKWTNLAAKAETTLEEYRVFAQQLNSKVGPLADNATNTLAQLRGSAEDLRGMVSPNSALNNELARALQQLGAAAQSIAELTQFLQQHPNALITGRQSTSQSP